MKKPQPIGTWELDCYHPGENWNTESEPKLSERNFLILIERHNNLVEFVNELAATMPLHSKGEG